MRFIGRSCPTHTPSVHVYIDGKSVATFDESTVPANTVQNPQMLECDIQGLENSQHEVIIVNNEATWFVFYAIDIDENENISSYMSIGNLIATAGEAQVSLSWTSVTGATVYNVKRSTTLGGPYKTIANNVNGTTYVDTAVTNGTTYYYVVTAITAAGESGNSNEASATPNKSDVPVPTGNVLLRIVMNDSSEREYCMKSEEATAFVNWYKQIASTANNACYTFNDLIDGSTEYLAFAKIISFKVLALAAK
jgi:fibronectin type 3 domain-containing protein